MKKIAVYQNMPFHYEMLGYIMEYATHCNASFDYYLEISSVAFQGWSTFYRRLFPTQKNIYACSAWQDNEYDHVILLTDNDPHFRNYQNVKQVIAIDHHARLRAPKFSIHIGTRFYQTRPHLEWILPCFGAFVSDVENKIQQVPTMTPLRIVIVGRVVVDYSFAKVKEVLHPLPIGDNYELHAINRRIPDHWKDIPHVYCYENVDASTMFRVVVESHYMALLDSNKDHASVSMSGAVPMSFTALTPLLMLPSFKEHSQLSTPLEITKDTHLPSDRNGYKRLVRKVAEERQRLLTQRNEILDKYVG